MSAGSSQSSDETSPRLRDLDLDDEHAYQHGHHAIPMQSPGDLDAELIMEPLGVRRQRGLSRLRRRVFFHGEDGSSSDPQRQHRRRILERITLRRRKQGEGDAFWTAILISSLLFFALMCYMSVYLTQTDVFAAHQGDLFGTTVDNRFTVVSQENERAVITLKSGYSNSRFSEAMVAFSEGELRMGRRALAPTDTQSFYGLSIFNNGSAAFTNRLTAPFVKTEYVHASKAIVFEDGTVMTTAANISGGVKEVGDLNVVSQTGAVSLSAGGKPVVVVNPDGTVSMQRTGSDRPEDPTASMFPPLIGCKEPVSLILHRFSTGFRSLFPLFKIQTIGELSALPIQEAKKFGIKEPITTLLHAVICTEDASPSELRGLVLHPKSRIGLQLLQRIRAICALEVSCQRITDAWSQDSRLDFSARGNAVACTLLYLLLAFAVMLDSIPIKDVKPAWREFSEVVQMLRHCLDGEKEAQAFGAFNERCCQAMALLVDGEEPRAIKDPTASMFPPLIGCKEPVSLILHRFSTGFRSLFPLFKIQTIGELSALPIQEAKKFGIKEPITTVRREDSQDGHAPSKVKEEEEEDPDESAVERMHMYTVKLLQHLRRSVYYADKMAAEEQNVQIAML
ncbi:hypothetical protein ATCC90586_004696 [Pythium insidiosum]|nr:hypothetical protein ATCC90586_004696 [Pythium insidiosum]